MVCDAKLRMPAGHSARVLGGAMAIQTCSRMWCRDVQMAPRRPVRMCKVRCLRSHVPPCILAWSSTVCLL